MYLGVRYETLGYGNVIVRRLEVLQWRLYGILLANLSDYRCLVGSPYRELISVAILKLQEDQMLQMLYDKWWKEYGGAGQCDTADDKVRKDANALTIANVGGVFVVLVVGLVLSPMVAVFEFIWNARRRRRRRAHDHSAGADHQAVPSTSSLSRTV